jgi:hypothetical protein
MASNGEVRLTENDELGRRWKKAVVADIKYAIPSFAWMN